MSIHDYGCVCQVDSTPLKVVRELSETFSTQGNHFFPESSLMTMRQLLIIYVSKSIQIQHSERAHFQLPTRVEIRFGVREAKFCIDKKR